MAMTKQESGRLGAEKSKPIQQAQYLQRVAEYNLNPYLCKHCNIKLEYDAILDKKSRVKSGKIKHLFCSHSCSAKYNNKNRIVVKYCHCGNTVTTTRYCSKQCKYIKLVEHDKSITPQTLKLYMIGKYGHRCVICNITEWMNKPAPLVLDHIDGNSDNNELDNLRLVCGNCDMQLPTYKGKNFGKGRSSRREKIRATRHMSRSSIS